MSEENKALVRRLWEEGINKANMAILDDVWARDCVYHEPSLGECRGPEAIKQVMALFFAAFPDGKVTIKEQVAEGDKVVTRWVFVGSHRGEFMGVAPTGKQVTLSGTIIARIAGDKIAEAWEVTDVPGLLGQLIAVPPIAGRDIERKAAFNAAKAAFSAYGGLLKDVAQELGMDKAVDLHARRCEAFYVSLAGMITSRMGDKGFDLSIVSAVFKDVNHSFFGSVCEIEESPGTLRCSYTECPIYDGLSSAGLDHQAIELICTGGESKGLEKFRGAFPQVSCSLKFRAASDQSCVQEFALGR